MMKVPYLGSPWSETKALTNPGGVARLLHFDNLETGSGDDLLRFFFERMELGSTIISC